MSFACTKHKIIICECYGTKVIDLESQLSAAKAEVEKLTKVIEERGYAFQEAVQKALAERDRLARVANAVLDDRMKRTADDLYKLSREAGRAEAFRICAEIAEKYEDPTFIADMIRAKADEEKA